MAKHWNFSRACQLTVQITRNTAPLRDGLEDGLKYRASLRSTLDRYCAPRDFSPASVYQYSITQAGLTFRLCGLSQQTLHFVFVGSVSGPNPKFKASSDNPSPADDVCLSNFEHNDFQSVKFIVRVGIFIRGEVG